MERIKIAKGDNDRILFFFYTNSRGNLWGLGKLIKKKKL